LITVPHSVFFVTLGFARAQQNGGKSMIEIQPSVTISVTVRSRRPREHLTEAEIERLMTVARRDGRYGHRDVTAILVAFRHGLRSSELVDLQWDQIDLVQKTIRINRVKNGTGATHYLSNSELRALRRLQLGPTSSSPSAAGRSRRHGSAR
jgi:integrase